jgi:CoA:oxalate CoA-transferase
LPGKGDAGRKLAIKDLWAGDDSLLFHTNNRNKESFDANLKNEKDLAIVKKTHCKANVLIHNFRPGVMERPGLNYATVHSINPNVVYAEVSGYCSEGDWKNLPGQDLFCNRNQGLTGLAIITMKTRRQWVWQ